jgi:hypothetical protein
MLSVRGFLYYLSVNSIQNLLLNSIAKDWYSLYEDFLPKAYVITYSMYKQSSINFMIVFLMYIELDYL